MSYASNPVSQMDSLSVICPYCLHGYYQEAEDYSEDERRITCGNCDREFLLHDEFSVTHYTRPIPPSADPTCRKEHA